MFTHEVAYRLTVVEARVAEGASIGEALDMIEHEPTRNAATAYIVAAREELPNGSASGIVRLARRTAQQDGRY